MFNIKSVGTAGVALVRLKKKKKKNRNLVQTFSVGAKESQQMTCSIEPVEKAETNVCV